MDYIIFVMVVLITWMVVAKLQVLEKYNVKSYRSLVFDQKYLFLAFLKNDYPKDKKHSIWLMQLRTSIALILFISIVVFLS